LYRTGSCRLIFIKNGYNVIRISRKYIYIYIYINIPLLVKVELFGKKKSSSWVRENRPIFIGRFGKRPFREGVSYATCTRVVEWTRSPGQTKQFSRVQGIYSGNSGRDFSKIIRVYIPYAGVLLLIEIGNFASNPNPCNYAIVKTPHESPIKNEFETYPLTVANVRTWISRNPITLPLFRNRFKPSSNM